MQQHLAQANYYRDPLQIEEYKEHGKFLPDINNEGSKSDSNATYSSNFVKLNRLVLVRANKDTMVYPKESEWFGAYVDGTYDRVVNMTETTWYRDDTFGLKTLHQKDKIVFETTLGNHLEFSDTVLLHWVELYFV